MYFTILLQTIYLAMKSHIGFYASIWERILFYFILFVPYQTPRCERMVGPQMDGSGAAKREYCLDINPTFVGSWNPFVGFTRSRGESLSLDIMQSVRLLYWTRNRIRALGKEWHSDWLGRGIRIRWTFSDSRGKGTFSLRAIRRCLITCGCGTINNEINRHNLTNKCRKADKEWTNSRKACRTEWDDHHRARRCRWTLCPRFRKTEQQILGRGMDSLQIWISASINSDIRGADLHHGPIKVTPTREPLSNMKFESGSCSSSWVQTVNYFHRNYSYLHMYLQMSRKLRILDYFGRLPKHLVHFNSISEL